jgi:hypothetical protein
MFVSSHSLHCVHISQGPMAVSGRVNVRLYSSSWKEE